MKYLQAHALFFRVGLRPDWKLHSVVRGGWFLADAHIVLFTFYAKSSRTISILTQQKTDNVVAFRGVLFIIIMRRTGRYCRQESLGMCRIGVYLLNIFSP